jgi:undecaprenyl diphosphate synthase
MRLSNFLLWQAAYAEYYSTPICWPDFGREELLQAFAEFARRVRRFGGLD